MRRQIEPLRRDGALPAARRDGQRGVLIRFTPRVEPQIARAVQRWGVRAAGDGVVAKQGDGHSHQIRIRQIDRAAMIAVQPQLDAAGQALQLPAISREKCLILCKPIRFAADHSRTEILILRIEPQLHGIRRDVHLPAAICRPRHPQLVIAVLRFAEHLPARHDGIVVARCRKHIGRARICQTIKFSTKIDRRLPLRQPLGKERHPAFIRTGNGVIHGQIRSTILRRRRPAKESLSIQAREYPVYLHEAGVVL